MTFDDILQTIKEIAVDAVDQTNPVKVVYGYVVSTNPLSIRVSENITLDSDWFLFARSVGSLSVSDKLLIIKAFEGEKYVVVGKNCAYEDLPSGGGGSVDPISEERINQICV